jgi:hypothetical protein
MTLLFGARFRVFCAVRKHPGSGRGDSTPERKRVSIPREDESVLAWWALQRDPGLSVRQLIRAEIKRGGYVDFANRPVGDMPWQRLEL